MLDAFDLPESEVARDTECYKRGLTIPQADTED